MQAASAADSLRARRKRLPVGEHDPVLTGGLGSIGSRPCPANKGPDVYRRGKDPEQEAFYFLSELEAIIRHWTAGWYHRQPNAGLCVPEVPGLEVSPLEMFAHGIASRVLGGSPPALTWRSTS